MTRYVPIESILNNISETIRNEVGDTALISVALEGYDLLGLPEQHETKIAFYEIENNKVELPDEVLEIDYVTYMATEPEQCDCDSFLSSCSSAPEALPFETRSNEICNYTINYKIFLDSAMYQKNFKPLKYVGTVGKDVICGKCRNRFCHDCNETFSVDKNKVLWTSIQEGFLCIEYTARMEENDRILIVDDPRVKRFLRTYAIANTLENRDLQESNTKYLQYLRQAEIALASAKGARILRGLDHNFISEIAFTQTYHQRFLRNPRIYRKIGI